jgi:hypothetical protein
MTGTIHKALASGRWFTFSLEEQLANVGSEVIRAISWRQRGDQEHFERAFERMLELLDLTISDIRWRKPGRLKELTRLREVLCDFFKGGNTYHTTPKFLEDYFYHFSIAARRDR